MNFVARIAETARRSPGQVAVEQMASAGVEATTYRELLERARQSSCWLTQHGMVRGDRAAILADNDAPWIAAYLGILQIGAVAVPLDTAYKAAQVSAVLENCEARIVYTTSRYLEVVKAGVGLLGRARPTIALLQDGFATGDSLPAVPTPLVDVADDEAAVILYTSGTTADPKGVVLTHGNLRAECDGALSVIDCSDRDAILGVLPLFHSLAQLANLLLPLAVGARVVFLETVSSTSLLDALQQRGITIFACVPQFFYLIHQRVVGEVAKANALSRMLFRTLLAANGTLRDRFGWNPGRRWFARVHRALGEHTRILVTGGSRFDPAIGWDLYALGFTILNGYGLTETSGAATVQRPGDRFTASVGQSLPGIEIRIDSKREREDATEESHGEILIRGPIVMREYFKRPDATADTLRDGWLYTGDLGRIDDAGRLYITGRKKEIIVLSSGKNLYPEEIEAHYRQSPFIKELCVLGLTRPDQPSAERLHAVVVPDEQMVRDRQVVNLRELIRFELEGLSVQLPPHKRILTYDVQLDPLPRTTTGKLKRHEIERLLRERTRHVEESTEPSATPEEQAWAADADHAASLQLIADRLQRKAIRPNANLELDLGLDSMERVELLTSLEARYNTQVPAEARAAIFTVRQLIEAVSVSEPAGPTLRQAHPEQPRGVKAGPSDEPTEVWDTLLAVDSEDIVADLGKSKLVAASLFFVLIRLFRAAAWLTVGFRASGQHHLPNGGAFLICPNHQSYLDGFFLAAALPFRTLRRMFFVGASEYFQTAFMKWLARLVNIVPVDPDANLVRAMQAGATGLRLAKVLVIFPEGERSIDGDLKKFRKGAAILSGQLGAPIVPVAMEGLFELWPRSRRFNWRALLPWVRPVVRVRFGAPMTIARGTYVGGTEALAASVGMMVEELRRVKA